jgi:hypothetical protein
MTYIALQRDRQFILRHSVSQEHILQVVCATCSLGCYRSATDFPSRADVIQDKHCVGLTSPNGARVPWKLHGSPLQGSRNTKVSLIGFRAKSVTLKLSHIFAPRSHFRNPNLRWSRLPKLCRTAKDSSLALHCTLNLITTVRIRTSLRIQLQQK